MWFISKKFLQKKYGKIFPLCVIVFFVALIHFIGTNRYLHQIALNFLYSIDEYIDAPVDYTYGLYKKFTYIFTTTEEYQRKIEKLQSELSDTQLLLKELEFAQIENAQLKQLLNFTDKFSTERITAKFFTIHTSAYINFGMINAGINQGIKNNSIVISSAGVIGRIVDALDAYSNVLMITDQNSKVPVVGLKSKQRGIFVGNNANGGTILYVEDTSALAVDEILVTSGDGSWFMDGVPVAKITKIDHDVIYAKPLAVDYQNEFVSVLIRK